MFGFHLLDYQRRKMLEKSVTLKTTSVIADENSASTPWKFSRKYENRSNSFKVV